MDLMQAVCLREGDKIAQLSISRLMSLSIKFPMSEAEALESGDDHLGTKPIGAAT